MSGSADNDENAFLCASASKAILHRSGKIAVKATNHYGDEALKVYAV